MSVVTLSQERRQEQRRQASGRREDEVSNDDLRALIEAQRRSCDRDREVFDRELSELKAALRVERERREKLTSRVLFWAGVFASLVFLANWIGPAVFRQVFVSIFGTP